MDPSKPANAKPPDIASASVLDTLAILHVNPDTGLTQAEVDVSRRENGYNEVAETKGHPVLKFLGKFWGISAWMLELIMVLSAVLRSIGPPVSLKHCGSVYSYLLEICPRQFSSMRSTPLTTLP
jgi:magnesium-transporting ATPase (P-type)